MVLVTSFDCRPTLGSNQIKSISKDAFTGLRLSASVNLLSNLCMSEQLKSSISVSAIAAAFCDPDRTEKSPKTEQAEEDSAIESSNMVPCNRTAFLMFPIIFWQKACLLNVSTVIDAEDFLISSESSDMTVLHFFGNDDISFLPIGVRKNFPELVFIQGNECMIKKISKANFQGLTELRYLYLMGNMITTIDGETFEDLISLIEIDLSKCLPSIAHN